MTILSNLFFHAAGEHSNLAANVVLPLPLRPQHSNTNASSRGVDSTRFRWLVFVVCIFFSNLAFLNNAPTCIQCKVRHDRSSVRNEHCQVSELFRHGPF